MAAIAAGAVTGAVLMLHVFAVAQVALRPDQTGVALAVAIVAMNGAIVGGNTALAGAKCARFGSALLWGSLVPPLVIGAMVATTCVESGSVGIILESTVLEWVFMVSIALQGAMCSGVAHIVNRSLGGIEGVAPGFRFYLREMMMLAVLWCGFFACMRMVFLGLSK